MNRTSPDPFGRFDRIVFEDFEFSTDPTNRPDRILAYCARELGGRGKWEVWQPTEDPAPLGPRDLLVAYQAGAELGCRARLGWQLPTNILCLHAEYCREVAGLDGDQYAKRGLLDALRVYGILHPFEKDKERLQKRALDPSGFSPEERDEMLAYCTADVVTTKKLFEKMVRAGCWATDRELDQGLFRGQFVGAQRILEGYGIPVDVDLWKIIQTNREDIKRAFIDRFDKAGIYADGVFKQENFERLALSLDKRWPRTPSGRCKKDSDTLKDLANRYPEIANLHELGNTLSALREPNLSIHNGRAYCYTAPFKSKTGRNQPSTTRFLFGAPKWMRSLIKPTNGRAIAYIDVTAEEFGIASLLSGDPAMWESYCAPDVYIDFAVRAGLVPPNATKATHPDTRRIAKAVVLGVQYGRGHRSTALALGISEQKGADLLWHHKDVYRVFWDYVSGVEQMARFRRCLYSVLGWRMRVPSKTRPTTIQNFPMQAGGAELMRAVTIQLVRARINLIAQVHDAFVIESDLCNIEADSQFTRQTIAKVSKAIFGQPLKSEAKIVRHPDRYIDEDAGEMLKTFGEVLKKYGWTQLLIPVGTHPRSQRNTL